MQDPLEPTISFGEFIRYAFRHWLLPAFLVLASAGAGLAYTLLQTPLYRSEAEIVVLENGSQPTQGASRSTILGNFTSLAESSKVVDPVAEELGIDSATITKNLTADNKTGTDTIVLSFVATDGHVARNTATELVTSFALQLEKVYKIKPASIVVTSTPSDPTAPYNIRTVETVAIAAAIGAALSLVIQFIRFDHAKSHQQQVQKALALPDATALAAKRLMAESLELDARIAEARSRISTASPKKPKATKKGK